MCMKGKVSELNRFAMGISEKFEGISSGSRFKVNSAHIESANAAINRTQAKTHGLCELEYLFPRRRQIYFMRL